MPGPAGMARANLPSHRAEVGMIKSMKLHVCAASAGVRGERLHRDDSAVLL